MRTVWSSAVAVVAVAVVAVALLPLALQAQAEKAEYVQAVNPAELDWQPVEGDPEARMAVLYGNPPEAGHYIIRIDLPPSWAGRPHTHGGDELITVHSGQCNLATGEDLTRDAAEELVPGSFIAVPAGTAMRGFSGEEGCLVDVQGEGPMTTQYLDEESGEEPGQ